MIKPKKILALNFGGIGDEILFLPALSSLKKEFPGAKITLALEPRSKSVKNLTDLIDDVICVDIKGKHKYFELLKFLLKARAGKFDMVFSSGANPMIPILLFLTGITYRYGYDSGVLSRIFLTKAVPLKKNRYASAMYHELVTPVTEIRTDYPQISVPECEKEPNSVLIHPGVSKISVVKHIIKTWKPEIWAELITKLLEKGKKVALVGGPDDEDCIKRILELVDTENPNFTNLYGTTKNIMDFAKLAKRAVSLPADMKFLIIHNRYSRPGGEEGVVALQRQLLESRGHTVLLYERSYDEIRTWRFGRLTSLFSALYNRRSVLDIREIVRREQPDAAIVHNLFPVISPAILPELRKARVRVLMTLHNYRLVCPTGLFHTLCGIPAILAGILTQLALYSVNLRIMGQANRPINSIQYDVLLSSRDVRALSIQNPIFIGAIFVVVIIAVLYWFFGTELGSSLRATGANQNMARAQGINTNVSKVLGLMLSNGLVALSSALLAQYQGFADVNMGRGAIVIGLAAVIIGEVLFSKVFHNFGLKLLAVAIGAVLYYLVYQVVIWLGLNPDDMKLVTALIVAAFLAIPYWKSRYFSKAGKRGAQTHA